MELNTEVKHSNRGARRFAASTTDEAWPSSFHRAARFAADLAWTEMLIAKTRRELKRRKGRAPMLLCLTLVFSSITLRH